MSTNEPSPAPRTDLTEEELDAVLTSTSTELLAYVHRRADPTETLIAIMANSDGNVTATAPSPQPEPVALCQAKPGGISRPGRHSGHRRWSPVAPVTIAAAIAVLSLLGGAWLISELGRPSGSGSAIVSVTPTGAPNHVNPHSTVVSVPQNQGRLYVATLPNSVFFRPGSAQFATSETKVLALLRHVISAWASGRYSRITVVGHCAAYGPAKAAVLLSRARAERVAELLRLHGVSYVTAVGVGFNQPLASNPRAASNRVVVITAFPKS